jgi:hypothetical protein
MSIMNDSWNHFGLKIKTMCLVGNSANEPDFCLAISSDPQGRDVDFFQLTENDLLFLQEEIRLVLLRRENDLQHTRHD